MSEDIMFETEVLVSEMKPGELLLVKKGFDKSLETEIMRLERYRPPVTE